MARAGIGELERGVDFFGGFDAERVNIFPVWRKEEERWLFFYEDAGPPRERNEGLIVLLRRRGLEVEAC